MRRNKLRRNKLRRDKLWGVMRNGHGYPLFKCWAPGASRPRYDGEPSEPLLFVTRRQAQAWCREQRVFYGGYPLGHVCRAWRFTVIRVERILTVRL